MNTKIIPFLPRPHEVEPSKLRPIELVKYIDNDYGSLTDSKSENIIEETTTTGKSFDNISLISKSGRGDNGFDIIAAWCNEDELENVCIYLGHWNDGVVE